jgi:hypothetical protein
MGKKTLDNGARIRCTGKAIVPRLKHDIRCPIMAVHHYTLDKIADWQTRDMLPALQRGFVWKPSQTENLWDSLLRRFPVGSFVLVPSENSSSAQFQLLDGQQRATAIAFGFDDPWAEEATRKRFWRFGDIR